MGELKLFQVWSQAFFKDELILHRNMYEYDNVLDVICDVVRRPAFSSQPALSRAVAVATAVAWEANGWLHKWLSDWL